MKQNDNIRIKQAAFVMAVIYAGGVLTSLFPAIKFLFIPFTPLILLLSIIVLFYFHSKKNLFFFLSCLVIIVSGFIIEAIGVNTGFIFGQYSYGNTLGFKLFNTPLIIGFNWLLVVYCAYVISQEFKVHRVLQIIVAALLTTFYDWFLEPAAIITGMWSWTGINIPFQNYVAWFVISIIFLTFLTLTKMKAENKFAFWLFPLQILFFILLNFTWGK